jgi:hypothetical protein
VTDPLRLSDDADPALAHLLRAGQREMPPRHALEKTVASLGATTTVIALSHAASAAVTAGKLGIWTLAKWAGVGVVSGIVTIGGVELVQHGIESNRPQAAADTSAATPKAVERVIDPRHGTKAFAAPVPSPGSESAPVLPQPTPPTQGRGPLVAGGHRRDVSGGKPSDQVGVPPTRRPEPVASEFDSTISIEIGLIDEARRALRAGRATSALVALNRHRTEVRRPRLAPEAQYLEMEALFAAGNSAAAERAARALLERYPKGPHAARAQSILAARGEPR